uniref:Matrix protein n=25 Tax=Drosophila melanogaster sigmavirus TaxID=1094373 RepID=A7WNC4_9RHAB|nr:matrix protein [Drosophila melanogaster sigmavirus Derby]AEQ37467.1 matrix protein [Drosophila melanogaster sigmavirus]AEQ37492.1 matrix protein [Drosophila melanogaster sigmavirus]AEQ37502.1 matrix protein [Drosophila melanogaster sigmavirus]AEQ37717.1 matrix protein [Drosophila melanogaster sigmavirus]
MNKMNQLVRFVKDTVAVRKPQSEDQLYLPIPSTIGGHEVDSPFAEPTAPTLGIIQSKCKRADWLIKSHLTITTNYEIKEWETWDRAISDILDLYDGNPVFKPILLFVYYVLAYNARKIPGPSNGVRYGAYFDELTTVWHAIPELMNQETDYSYNHRVIHRKIQYVISFKIQMSSTKRRTSPIESFIEVTSEGLKHTPQFTTILDRARFVYSLTGGRYVIHPF